MNNDGYIRSHRSDRDHWTWKKPRHYMWWQDIRFEVNHTPGGGPIKGKHIECGRGQSIRSIASWARRWETSITQTKRFLKLLIKHKDISIEVIPNRTIRLTVLNYDYISPRCTPSKSTGIRDTEYVVPLSVPLNNEKCTPYTPIGTMDTEDVVPLDSKKMYPNIKNEDSCLTEKNSLEKKESYSSLNLSLEHAPDPKSPGGVAPLNLSSYNRLNDDLKTFGIKKALNGEHMTKKEEAKVKDQCRKYLTDPEEKNAPGEASGIKQLIDKPIPGCPF